MHNGPQESPLQGNHPLGIRPVDNIVAPGIGAAWLSAAQLILETGRSSSYDSLPIREVSQLTITSETADPHDEIISRLADQERLAWMRDNFRSRDTVAALSDAASYASRLFDYSRAGRDQVQWVIERLLADPSSRSATITMLEPMLDSSYIPCVSLLDFWIPDTNLDLVVYCHSIDFGAKGYGNLVELAALQQHVAAALGSAVGRLTMVVKSAHVYETEFAFMSEALQRHSSETHTGEPQTGQPSQPDVRAL